MRELVAQWLRVIRMRVVAALATPLAQAPMLDPSVPVRDDVPSGVVGRRAWIWPTLILMLTIAANVLVWAEVDSPLRAAIVVVFLLICPGAAWVLLSLRIHSPATEWMLALALSLALDIIVATALVYSGLWSARWGMGLLGFISALGSILQFVRPTVRGVGVGSIR